MSPAELREMNYRELTEKLAESKEELFNLRFQLATNQLDNTARIGAVKKTVARIRTILRQREIELWYAQQEAAAAQAEADAAGEAAAASSRSSPTWCKWPSSNGPASSSTRRVRCRPGRPVWRSSRRLSKPT